jgi:hypothetical protein
MVDFESGFTQGQNVSGVTGLFPGGDLVITDTSSAHSAMISGSSSDFGGTPPVGSFSLAHNEAQYLELSFLNPVHYVAFQDFDHTNGHGIVTFADGGTENFSFDGARTNAGAEFVGLYNNDMPLISKIQLYTGGDNEWGIDTIEYDSTVPIPGALWLLGSGLLGLIEVRRRKMGQGK